jgi:hypothetical protein
MRDLGSIYKTIFSFGPQYFSLQHLLVYQDPFFFAVISFGIAVLFLKELNEEFAIINRYERGYAILKPALYISFIVLIFVLGNFSANTFIYFHF